MMLAFNSGGIPFLIGVGRRRELSVAAPITKYVFVFVSDLGKYRSMSKEETSMLDELKVRVEGFRSLGEVKEYVIDELSKLGMVFTRELSVDDYKALISDFRVEG